ncbi:MAG: hypothetical protein ACTHJH_13760 [Marmoricola sp.]
MTTRFRERSEEGAVLVLALLIVTTVALVAGALLTRGSGNFLATVSLRQVAGTAYAGDAAAKMAINDLEQGSNAPDVQLFSSVPTPWVFDNNVDGTGCFGSKADPAKANASLPISSLTLRNVYPATGGGSSTTATVTCTAVPGTGIFGTAQGADDNGVGRAVTILGTGSSALEVNPQGHGNAAPFQIHGDIAVAGGIQVDHGILFTTGSVSAHPCPSASLVSANGACTDSGGSVADPLAARAPDLTTVPTQLGTWSGCTFQPGYYDDAYALTAATNACTTSTFAPGVYYFDFHNNSGDPTYSPYALTSTLNGSCAGTGDVWVICKNVIGGDTAGGSNTIPGQCKNPIDKPGNNGVQFVFGGDSQISLGNNANVELCAPGTGASPPIALYGLDGASSSRGQLTAGYANTVQQNPSITAGTVVSSQTGNQPDFKPNPNNVTGKASLAAEDGTTESFSANSGNNAPSLTLSSFTPATTIPQGSLLTAAKLIVKHNETATTSKGNASSVAPHLTVSVGAASKVDVSSSLTNTSTTSTPNTLKKDTVDLTQNATLIKALAAAVHNGDLSGLSAAFSEDAKGNTTANVDFVQLQLTYFTPTLRGQTATAIPGNCVAALTCDMVVTGNGSSFAGAFVVQGALYAPNGKVDLSLGNQTAVVAMRWGLVAKAAVLGSLSQFPFAYPVVSIPDAGPGFGPSVSAVDLRVFLCTGNGPCATTGQPVLTSRVKITDPVGANGLVNPAPGTRKIDVLSWSEQR